MKTENGKAIGGKPRLQGEQSYKDRHRVSVGAGLLANPISQKPLQCLHERVRQQQAYR